MELLLGIGIGIAICTPLLLIFGVTWYNVKRMERGLKKQQKFLEQELKLDLDPETKELLDKADSLLTKNVH